MLAEVVSDARFDPCVIPPLNHACQTLNSDVLQNPDMSQVVKAVFERGDGRHGDRGISNIVTTSGRKQVVSVEDLLSDTSYVGFVLSVFQALTSVRGETFWCVSAEARRGDILAKVPGGSYHVLLRPSVPMRI